MNTPFLPSPPPPPLTQHTPHTAPTQPTTHILPKSELLVVPTLATHPLPVLRRPSLCAPDSALPTARSTCHDPRLQDEFIRALHGGEGSLSRETPRRLSPCCTPRASGLRDTQRLRNNRPLSPWRAHAPHPGRRPMLAHFGSRKCAEPDRPFTLLGLVR